MKVQKCADDDNIQSEPVLVGNGRRKNESWSYMLSPALPHAEAHVSFVSMTDGR